MKDIIALIVLLTLVNGQTNGEWKEVNVQDFVAWMPEDVEISQQAVEDKYSPSQQGYYFSEVVLVEAKQHSVPIFRLVLKYENVENSSQFYEVTIQNGGWVSYKVLNCEQILGKQSEFMTSQENYDSTNATNDQGVQTSAQNNDNCYRKEDPVYFEYRNQDLVNMAQEGVDSLYAPQQQGFQYKKIVSVQSCMKVGGPTYKIILEYVNKQNASQYYEVTIATGAWKGPGAVENCQQISGYSNNQSNYAIDGFRELDPVSFESQNSEYMQLTKEYIEKQYSPSNQGYKFEKVISAQQGINMPPTYIIEFEYVNNDNSSKYYEVKFKDGGWNGYRVVDSQQKYYQSADYVANESNNQVSKPIVDQKERVIKPSSLGLKIRKQKKVQTEA